jgi:hypothetical protein
MSALLVAGLTLLGSMSIGAGLGAEGYIGNALLILGGFLFGVVALVCVEDHEKEENKYE